jgi:hypothetical protein
MLRQTCRILLATAAAGIPAAPTASPSGYTHPVLFADYSDSHVIRVGNDFYMLASSFHFCPGTAAGSGPVDVDRFHVDTGAAAPWKATRFSAQ